MEPMGNCNGLCITERIRNKRQRTDAGGIDAENTRERRKNSREPLGKHVPLHVTRLFHALLRQKSLPPSFS